MNPAPGPRFSARARTLQRIDRLAGVPVCAVLTAVRRLGDLFRGPQAEGEPGAIVFLKLAEQGSTVLAYDAIRAAVDRVGRDRVYFLAFKENRFIVDALGLIPERNVLTIRTRSLGSMIASALARLRELRRMSLWACIDMEFFARASTRSAT